MNLTEKKVTISLLTAVSLIILAVVAGLFLCIDDSGKWAAFRWLLAIFALAFFLRPYLYVKNLIFPDEGFSLSFGLGLALCFLLAWFLPACGILSFGSAVCFAAFLLLAAAPFVLARLKKADVYKWNGERAERFLLGFAVFAACFFLAYYIIGFTPVIDSGTENYMDFGFMESIYRQQQVAPYDIWFAGEKLNYYYLGQAAAVYLCRMAFTTPEYGYNLMLATFWAMVFTMTGEIAYGVVMALFAGKSDPFGNSPYSRRLRKASSFSAFAASFMSALAANGHWLLYGLFVPWLMKIFVKGGADYIYWFSDPTVYISTASGDIDNGKNEFPAYSALLGDLHAHVINVIFVLPLLALLLDYIFDDKNEEKETSKRGIIRLVICGFLLALYKGSNYWDFAMYFVITGAIVVFSDIGGGGFKKEVLFGVAKKAAIVIAVSFLAALPFTLNFAKMSSQILPADNHSPFSKLVVLWLPSFAVTVSAVIYMFAGRDKKKMYPKCSRWGLLAFYLCVMGLVITPEFIYIRDIYGEANARFNTMFKMTYQAFILFGIIWGISAGTMLYKIYEGGKKRGFYVFASGLIALTVLASSTYTIHAVKDWMGNVFEHDSRRGISCLEGLYTDYDYMYDMKALDTLNEDERKVLNIVEAAGGSYTHTSELSVLSGTCTVVGWFVHEWMWRNDADIVKERAAEVQRFYESGDEAYCRDFLEKYDIDYIYTGPAEYGKYYINLSGYEALGETLWSVPYGDQSVCLIKVK